MRYYFSWAVAIHLFSFTLILLGKDHQLRWLTGVGFGVWAVGFVYCLAAFCSSLVNQVRNFRTLHRKNASLKLIVELMRQQDLLIQQAKTDEERILHQNCLWQLSAKFDKEMAGQFDGLSLLEKRD